jgi:hypothetical protein
MTGTALLRKAWYSSRMPTAWSFLRHTTDTLEPSSARSSQGCTGLDRRRLRGRARGAGAAAAAEEGVGVGALASVPGGLLRHAPAARQRHTVKPVSEWAGLARLTAATLGAPLPAAAPPSSSPFQQQPLACFASPLPPPPSSPPALCRSQVAARPHAGERC